MTPLVECVLTAHAQHRCDEMGVTADEVATSLTFPELTYPSPPRYGADRQISVAGRLAVVHRHHDGITVLWHRRDGRG